MASTEKDFQAGLKEAGTRLLDPPPSVQELLQILDQVWMHLLKVEQSPGPSMQDALSPSSNALIGDKLLRHSDIDIKAAVASCISEITRITAPDAPYDDDQMKEVFQLIVSSFEHLFDHSSPSYNKRTSTLETVAKVRSCVVMLDLECDDLIIEMFQHFLKSIRDYHPPKVFSSMETIMKLVFEESEDIAPELLSPILASVKNDNKDVLPIARKLGESVLKCSATRVGQYLVHAVEALGLSVDDYSKIVASICRETRDSAGQNDVSAPEPMAHESNTGSLSLEETKDTNQGAQETAIEPSSSQQADSVSSDSQKSIRASGITQAGDDNSLVDMDLPEKHENLDPSHQGKEKISPKNCEPKNLDANKAADANKNEQNTNSAGTRSSYAKPSAPSESTLPASEMEAEKLDDSRADNTNISPLKVPSVDVAVPEANDKDAGVNLLSQKGDFDESEVTSSLPLGKNRTGESGSGSDLEKVVKVKRSDPKASKAEQSMKKAPSASSEEIKTRRENQISENGSKSGIENNIDIKKDANKAADVASGKISGETSDHEANQRKRSVKKTSTISSEDVKTPNEVQSSKKVTLTNESGTKKQTSKRVCAGNESAIASHTKEPEEQKRQSRVTTTSEKPASKFSAKEEDKASSKSSKSTKDEREIGETPKTNLKRKRATGNEKESETRQLGEDIVGSNIKVWWPQDKMFYKGVVDSFDPVKKKHKIAYNDGDIEILNLKKQKYELLEDGSDSDKEEESNTASLDMSSEMPSDDKRELVVGLVYNEREKNSSSKSGRGTSRKSKATKAGSKVDGKSQESMSSNKSKEDVGGKSKDLRSRSGSKSKDGDISKSSNLKDGGVSTRNLSAKSKKETPRTGKTREETPSNASKGKSARSGGKSDANGKMKSSLSKQVRNESPNTKGKLPTASKAQASESKTGRKRRRT